MMVKISSPGTYQDRGGRDTIKCSPGVTANSSASRGSQKSGRLRPHLRCLYTLSSPSNLLVGISLRPLSSHSHDNHSSMRFSLPNFTYQAWVSAIARVFKLKAFSG